MLYLGYRTGTIIPMSDNDIVILFERRMMGLTRNPLDALDSIVEVFLPS
jgi:hypothetical protein